MSAYSEIPNDEAVGLEATPVEDARKEHQNVGRNVTLTIALSSLALTGYAIAANPPGSTNIEAAFTFNDRNDAMSTIATNLTGYQMRIACDDELLERAGGLEISIDGKEYPVQGRVYPLSLLGLGVAVPVAVLREDVCETILDTDNLLPEVQQTGALHATHYEAPIRFARAVVTLLHEREHTVQVFDEAAANCYAYQKLPSALTALGMNPEIVPIVSQGLLNDAAGETYPPSYYSDECRPGGALDLQLSDVYLQK